MADNSMKELLQGVLVDMSSRIAGSGPTGMIPDLMSMPGEEPEEEAEHDHDHEGEEDTATTAAPASGDGSTIINPVPGGTFVDTMGADRDGGKRKHKGTDIFGKKGSPAVAPIGGTVVKAGSSGKGGLRVWIKGTDGRYHYLAHLDRIDVRQGQTVTQGQQIGTVGNTGNAKTTPPHVHYSINSQSEAEDAIGNPALELKGQKSPPAKPAQSSPRTRSAARAARAAVGSTQALGEPAPTTDNGMTTRRAF
ncbi:MAG TPA: M23 family metallopeptidase [Acidimicrobiales bacterium]|nr:M23 family metallopeptidase [Acidimicrobiales bacterium]